jgi:CHAT domain-containing protein
LDEQFTRAHLLAALKEGFPLVHIASHFTFRPGDANDSFLLLGDGDHLTLAEIQALPDSLLAGVDLLTLSACETADGGADANGREVENVAVLAQRKGADAVLASLWPVSDEGTATLMQNFYRQRQGHPEQGKAEALREAQLKLRQGEYATLTEANRGTRVVTNDAAAGAVPRYEKDPKAPFAHPYYWAPFILMGNWR